MPKRSWTILVVEDEAAIRSLVDDVLASAGYRVFVAEDADRALAFSQTYEAEIDLLLVDIVLPGHLNGYELTRRLIDQRPQLRIVYTSGFFGDQPRFAGDLAQPGRTLLPKPFTVTTLLDIVAQMLADPVGQLR
jgi:CheY-like chemotaxis protein